MTKEEKARLIEVVGQKSYNYLIHGGFLQLWRGSSPHNWFIQNKQGMLWHSGDREPMPKLTLFKIVKEDGKVIRYWGADSGKPLHVFYKLKGNTKC